MTERLVTARELGAQLGFSAGTIVDWAEQGRVPCFKVGGRLRFRPSEVETWLEERRVTHCDSLGVPCGRPDRVA